MDQYTPNPDRYDGRMPYRRCGNSGLLLPELSLGCWHNFGGSVPTQNQMDMLTTAFDAGITHFDLANNYGPPYGSAESNVGKLLKQFPRDELIISSKAGYDMWPGPYGEWGSRKYLLASLDQSLKRLDLDYVDIFYSHRFDPDTPMEETLGALDTAVRQGKALYAGISSYDSIKTQQAVEICRDQNFPRILIHQPNYSMLNRWVEKSLLNVCKGNGIGVIAFCPLFQGLLTDKYLNGIPEGSRGSLENSPLRKDELAQQVVDVVRKLNHHASERGQTLAQMAISWLLKDERVTTVLIGASRPEQIAENCKAVQNTSFDDEEIQKLDKILANIDLPPSLWLTE